jgi:hypothetical protein
MVTRRARMLAFSGLAVVAVHSAAAAAQDAQPQPDARKAAAAAAEQKRAPPPKAAALPRLHQNSLGPPRPLAAGEAATLGGQIAPFLRKCMPATYGDAIDSYATLHLGSDGSLQNIFVTRQDGVNQTTMGLAQVRRNCIIRSAKMASPYGGLVAENYTQWQTTELKFRIR